MWPGRVSVTENNGASQIFTITRGNMWSLRQFVVFMIIACHWKESHREQHVFEIYKGNVVKATFTTCLVCCSWIEPWSVYPHRVVGLVRREENTSIDLGSGNNIVMYKQQVIYKAFEVALCSFWGGVLPTPTDPTISSHNIQYLPCMEFTEPQTCAMATSLEPNM